MSLKRKLASGLAVSAIALGGLLAVPAAAYATGNPSALDRGDLTQQCQNQYGASGWAAQLTGSGAYGWKCVYLTKYSDQRNIDINAYCMNTWGVWAATHNPSDPNSWYCQGY